MLNTALSVRIGRNRWRQSVLLVAVLQRHHCNRRLSSQTTRSKPFLPHAEHLQLLHQVNIHLKAVHYMRLNLFAVKV